MANRSSDPRRRRRGTRPAALAVLAGAATVVLAGCGAPQATSSAARDAAVRFEQAVAGGRASEVCATLAASTLESLTRSGDSCEAAVTELGLTDPGALEGVEVWGRAALARYAGGAAFLDHTDHGWRVLAAGCELEPDRPAGCLLGAG